MNDKTGVLENFYHNQVLRKYQKDPEEIEIKNNHRAFTRT